MEHMTPTLLLQTVTDVAEAFTRLGGRLESVAQALQTAGTLPDKSLIPELMTARNNFADLRAQGHALAQSLAITPLPGVESLTSLDEIRALLKKITSTVEERQTAEQVSQRAVVVLNRVCALRHSGAETFAPLVACQTRAAALRDEITNMEWPHVHPVAESIAKEDDAFSALLTIVENGDQLDDELCGAFQEVIGLEFGNPLAIAALRGKLVFTEVSSPPPGGDPNGQEPPPFGGEPSASFAPVVATRQEMETESTASPLSESVASTADTHLLTEPAEETDVGTAPVKESLGTLSVPSDVSDSDGQRAPDVCSSLPVATPLLDTQPAPLPEREPPKSAPTHEFYRFTLEERAQKIASILLLLSGTNSSATERSAILCDLVWRLVFEERISLAFHIAQSVEMHHPEVRPRLPSWLLRALVLGQRLRTPRREIARTLQEDFAQSHDKVWETGNPEWDTAAELLLIAAAVVPALLAPETKAATILRGLHVEESLPQLAAYCACVASYSEQGVPLDPSFFKRVVRLSQPEVIGFVRVGQGKADRTYA
ncbi:MAG: hypothetical protein EXR78_05555 [Deltaproteobacteria bacterium]|nr:hypothetical protein [Deltaproteobacteria bacterium]